jgi:hypothetical protein
MLLSSIFVVLFFRVVHSYKLPKHTHAKRERNSANTFKSYQAFLSIGEYDVTIPAAIGVASLGVIGTKVLGYWKSQFAVAELIGGIPPNCQVVELDAQDGKNVFYLPKGSEYTAIMKADSDPKKMKEKANMNEQLILECIGKANR